MISVSCFVGFFAAFLNVIDPGWVLARFFCPSGQAFALSLCPGTGEFALSKNFPGVCPEGGQACNQ